MEASTSETHQIKYDEVLSESGEEEITDSQDELVEPRFRYKRILGDLIRLMENDAASCFCVNEKIIVVGFQSGRVCIFDHMGNVNIDSCTRHHKCAVTCVSVDDSANYIATCANDFTVVIFGIGCADYNQRLSMKTSPKFIAISPEFSRQGSGQSFVIGTQDLTLYERGIRAEFLSGKRRETILYKGMDKDGWICCISWKNSLLAFTNETGTRIYDLKVSRCLTLIQPIHKSANFPISKFPPKHIWLNSTTLAIGWANSVCVCGIFDTPMRSNNTSTEFFDFPKKHGQILHRFVFSDFLIAGLSFTTHSSYGIEAQHVENIPISTCMQLSSPSSAAHLNYSFEPHTFLSPISSNENLCKIPTDEQIWRELILLGIKRNEPELESDLNSTDRSLILSEQNTSVSNMDDGSYSTQLLLIKPLTLQQYFIEAEDTIEMRNVNTKLLHRFTLCSLPLDDIYYIFSPREVIEAVPCSIDYRINWMLENGLYEDALESATRNSEFLRENTVLDVGKRLINHLIERNYFETAVGYMREVCSKIKVEWEFYVNEFDRHHQVLKLLPVLPTKDPQLEPEIYETVLTAALYTRPKLFYTLVAHWDPNIYRAASVYQEVSKLVIRDFFNKRRQKSQKDPSLEVYDEKDRIYLLRAFATLSLHCRKYGDAIKAYLILRDPVIFGVVERHKLFLYVKDNILDLMEINQSLTIRLLLENEDLISNENVVNLLENHPKIQLAYLHHLQTKGKGTMYSDKLIKLYSEHDRTSLLPFLRKNEYYRLDKALSICQAKNFTEEVVYLLGRSGNRLEALDLMVNRLLKIDMAIDFCVENDDPELWERLIESAISRPEQITCLLKRMASIKINSLDVVEKIPSHMEIPDLRHCLLQVLKDHEQQSNLLKHSRDVATSDVIKLFEMQVKPLAISSLADFKPDIQPQEQKCIKCQTSLVKAGPVKSEVFLLADGHFVHEICMNVDERTKMNRQRSVANANL